MLVQEDVVFPGFAASHLGESAQASSESYNRWYTLTNIARRDLSDMVDAHKTRLPRSFESIGFTAWIRNKKGESWDGRRVRRAGIYLWLGVYPWVKAAPDDLATDWYPTVELHFAKHPNRSALISDARFLGKVRGLEQTGLFRLQRDGFFLEGSWRPASEIVSPKLSAEKQTKKILKYWRDLVIKIRDSGIDRLLLTFHG